MTTPMKGQTGFSTSASGVNVQDFVMRQMLHTINTAEPVRVEAVHFEDAFAGTVDVMPLVNLVTGDGSSLGQSQLFTLPYLRVQGGKQAFIVDPRPGDIGLAVFAMRDTESFKAQRGGPVNPGSARACDKGDGFYLGGFLNEAPERFVRIDEEGVTIEGVARVHSHGAETVINAESAFTVNAESSCVINAAGGCIINASAGCTINGDVLINGSLTWTGTAQGQNNGPACFSGGWINNGGKATSNGITLESHVHGGVEAGPASTGAPQ